MIFSLWPDLGKISLQRSLEGLLIYTVNKHVIIFFISRKEMIPFFIYSINLSSSKILWSIIFCRKSNHNKKCPRSVVSVAKRIIHQNIPSKGTPWKSRGDPPTSRETKKHRSIKFKIFTFSNSQKCEKTKSARVLSDYPSKHRPVKQFDRSKKLPWSSQLLSQHLE